MLKESGKGIYSSGEDGKVFFKDGEKRKKGFLGQQQSLLMSIICTVAITK